MSLTSSFAMSFTGSSPSSPKLQSQFDDERNQKRKKAIIVEKMQECRKRRKQLDQTFNDAMKKGGGNPGSYAGRSLFSSAGRPMTPQAQTKRIHFIPSSGRSSVRYDLTDSPSVKFEKKWKSYSDTH